jgi:hypothetical protein
LVEFSESEKKVVGCGPSRKHSSDLAGDVLFLEREGDLIEKSFEEVCLFFEGKDPF